MISHISYLELHSAQPKAIAEFYAKLFGKSVAPTESGGGMPVGDAYFAVSAPSEESSLPEFGFDVEDLDAFLSLLSSLDVPHDDPEEIESGGKRYRSASFRDPDGRLVSVFQPL